MNKMENDYNEEQTGKWEESYADVGGSFGSAIGFAGSFALLAYLTRGHDFSLSEFGGVAGGVALATIVLAYCGVKIGEKLGRKKDSKLEEELTDTG